MKNLFTFLLVICLSVTINFSAKAGLTGAEISYTCTSTPGTWVVTLILYRSCQGIPFCSGSCNASCTKTISINGADASCNGTSFGTASVSLVSVSDVGFNALCPSAKSICTNMGCVTAGTYIPGIEKYVFQGSVNLGSTSGIPASCCNVRLSWQECCRNNNISTGAAGNNLYVEAVMNRCLSLSPCNGAPQLMNEPLITVCGGQPLLYNYDAVDPDNDSLSYSFAPALTGVGTSVPYTPPYSAQQPMPFYPPASGPFPLGISCDAGTGNIMFTPPAGAGGQFVGVMSTMIKQWKIISGVPTLMGTTSRDIEMWLMSCPGNNPPRIQTVPQFQTAANTNISINAYRGFPLCFDVIAKDTDFLPFNSPPISDTTYINWNNSLVTAGATFTRNYIESQRKINGPREDNMKFCWTPSQSAVRASPYYINMTAIDSRCPNPGRRSQTFSIWVSDSPVINIIKKPLSCNWSLSFSSSIPDFVSTYEWQVSNTKGLFNIFYYTTYNTQTVSNFNFNDTGKYVVRLLLNKGTQNALTFYDTLNQIFNAPFFNPPINDTSTCNGKPVTLQYNASGGKPPYSYRWFLPPDTFLAPLNGPFYILNNFTVSPVTTTRYTVQLRDINGCRAYDSNVIVTVNNNPVLIRPQAVQICKSTKLSNLNSFQANPPGGVGVWSYPFAPGAIIPGATAQIRTDSLKALPVDTLNYNSGFDNWIQYKYTDPTGCINYDSATVRVFGNPNVIAGFGVKWCKNAGIFKLENDLSRSILYNLWYAIPVDATGQIGVWSGNGVNAILFGANTRYEFDPMKAGVLTFPSNNILTYKYTKQYSWSGAPSCQGQDTVLFEVMPAPVIDAGSMAPVCNNDTVFYLSARAGATSSSGASGFWTYAAITPKYGIDLALKDSQNFDPSKIIFPVTTPPTVQYSWKLYFNDMSTGCAVKDSLILTVIKMPNVDLMLNPISDSLLCLKTGSKTLLTSVSPTGGTGTFTSNPITTAFAQDPFDQSKAIFNTYNNTLSAGIYKLIYTYSIQVLTTICKNSDTATVNVGAIPVTTITGPSNVNPSIPYNYTANNTIGSSYNWGVTNGNIVSGQGTRIVNVSFNSKGISELKVIETTVNGCKDTVTKNITVNTTGINGISVFKNVNIYPNPANTELNIELGDVHEETTIELIDILGKVIMQQSISAKRNFNEKLDVSELARGVYFISIKVGEQKMQSKVVLK